VLCLLPRIADYRRQSDPRERLTSNGSKIPATAELIAPLLGTGQAVLSAVGLGQHLLQELGKHQRDPLAVQGG